MKKLLVIGFLLTLCTVSQAQLIRGYGLKVGGTIAHQAWDYTGQGSIPDADGKTGFNIGGFIEFLDIPTLSIVGEVNYVQKKAEQSINIIDANETFQSGNDYLNLSALAKMRFSMVVVAPYIIAGPKADFSLKSYELKIPDNFKKARLGFKVGAGTEVDLKIIHLLAEFIYDYDVNNLYEGNNLKIKSNSFDFRLGIYL